MTKNELDQLISNASRISLPVHLTPDFDSICSVIVLYDYISNNFPDKNILMLSEDKLPYLAELNEYTSKFLVTQDITPHLNNSDLVIFTDMNEFNRAMKRPEQFKNLDVVTLCIDHHATEPDDFKYKHIESNSISAIGILANLLYPEDSVPSERIVEILLIGIMSDSGSLMHISKKSSDTLDTVKKLLLYYPLELSRIHSSINSINDKEMNIFSHLLNNLKQVQIKNYPLLSYTYLLQNQTEGLEYEQLSLAYHKFQDSLLRNYDSFKWGFILVPKDKKLLNISFRSSKGYPNVDKLAVSLGGGGHKKASGAKIPKFNINEDTDQACLHVLNKIEELHLITE